MSSFSFSVRLGRIPEVSKLELKGLLPRVAVILDKSTHLWSTAFLGSGRGHSHELGVSHSWNRKSSHLGGTQHMNKVQIKGRALHLNFLLFVVMAPYEWEQICMLTVRFRFIPLGPGWCPGEIWGVEGEKQVSSRRIQMKRWYRPGFLPRIWTFILTHVMRFLFLWCLPVMHV